MTPDHVRGGLSNDAGATSSSIIWPIAPSPMPMLSNARSTTPSPVSTTSDNLIPRKFSYGLLSHTGHSWGSLISSVWFEPLAPAPRGRFLPLAPAKTVQAVRRAHLEAFKTGRDRRPVRNIERMLDAPLRTGAVSIAKYAA